jgi:PadR family transcriptional regulator
MDKTRNREQAELLQGILDLLILQTLDVAPLHGWGISKSIRRMSHDVLTVNQGSLYPALYRLETAGYIKGAWGTSPEGREAKFYSLTRTGRKQLRTESDSWRLFSHAVNEILKGAAS